MIRYLLVFLGVLGLNIASAQQVLNMDLLASYSVDEVEDLFGFQGLTHGVDHYVVSYSTTGTDGFPDTAGAVVALPSDPGTSFPVLIYHHGTVNNRFDVPSLGSNEAELGLLFASLGYISLVPDYIGMSSSRGYHPYLHVETQARASQDLLISLSDYMDAEGISYQKKLFLTGYSQGGHASASTHRTLQENPVGDYEIVAASHLSGPYSLAGVMLDFILSDEQYFTVAYVPHLVLGLQEAYGNLFNELNEVFKAPYDGIIEQLYENAGLFTINQQLVTQLIINEGQSVAKLMFQDSVLANIVANENHPMRIALKDNDLSTWVPDCPTRLVYCMADEQVNFMNAVVTDSIMNALGADDVLSVDIASDQNHGGCVTPALFYTINFFQQFPTNNEENGFQQGVEFEVYGSDDHIIIESENPIDAEVYLTTIDGKLIYRENINQLVSQRIPYNEAGTMIVTIQTDRGLRSYKVLMN